jgi:hypothetical protein
MSYDAFKMQAFAANEQRRRISNFLTEQKQKTPAPTVASLQGRAQALREAWGLGATSASKEQSGAYYAFDSHYRKGDGAGAEQRAWSNWLVPGRLMVGRYPHCQPAIPGPTASEARSHLARVSQAGVDGFICLQAEVPPQGDPSRWPEGGVYLPEASDRRRWPAPFLRYAEDAIAAARQASKQAPPAFYYFGIPDLAVRSGLLTSTPSLALPSTSNWHNIELP